MGKRFAHSVKWASPDVAKHDAHRTQGKQKKPTASVTTLAMVAAWGTIGWITKALGGFLFR